MDTLTSTPKRSVFLRYFLSLMALTGFGFSLALSQHFYAVRNGTSGFKSFCKINSEMNCDIVAASPYAELVFGLPLSSFSTGWFLAFFLVSLFGYRPHWQKETTRALFVFSVLGVCISLPYFFLMLYRLKTLCLFCLIIDVLNLAALVLSFFLMLEFKSLRLNGTQWKVFASIFLLSMGVGVTGSVLLFRPSGQVDLPGEVEATVQKILNSPRMNLNLAEAGLAFGPPQAPITVVEFSDLQCPACKQAAFQLNSVRSYYPDQVRVIFRHFPLDATCNPMLKTTPHPCACEAARVATCADQQGKFERVYEELFQGQSLLQPGYAIQVAIQQGVDPHRLDSCIHAPETELALLKDIEDAKRLGISATPTFFVSGYKMEGAYSVAVWKKIIAHLLTK